MTYGVRDLLVSPSGVTFGCHLRVSPWVCVAMGCDLGNVTAVCDLRGVWPWVWLILGMDDLGYGLPLV